MIRRNSGTISTIKDEDTAEASKKAVLRYLVCLIAAVLFFIVLSYLIQNRNNSRMDRLYSENATATQHIEILREEYTVLQKKYDELLILYNNLKDETGTEVSKND